MKKLLCSVAIAASAVVGFAGPASAATRTGAETFRYVIQGSFPGDQPTASAVVASGVINDAGRDQFVASQPGEPDEVYHDAFELSKGTLSFVTVRTVDEATPPDPRTCMGSLRMSGTFEIGPGAVPGAYGGVSGAGTFSQHGRYIAKRLPGGGCSDTEGIYFIFGEATGTVTVSG